MTRLTLSIVAGLLCTQAALAQQQPPQQQKAIPIRQLGAITAVAKDTLGARIVTRGLSNGSVFVGVFPFGDPNRKRVKLFDSTLQHFTVVRDSTNNPQLIAFTGDSTLAVELSSQTLLVLDPLGKVVRTMAHPKQSDFLTLQQGFALRPGIDPQGRLIYLGVTPPPPRDPARAATGPETPFQPDSAPIVRANFDTRKIDTLATIRIRRVQTSSVTQDGQNIAWKFLFDPTSVADEWAMLSDGTIAVVRSQDYHIDWVDPDGSRRSTPKMPFDWKRITDAEKQFTIDSMKTKLDSLAARNQPRTIQTPNGPLHYSYRYEVLPADKFPDYQPPISLGSVRADLDGNLWIVPRTSSAAKGGVLYDVVNRKGEITERVQLPSGVAIVGFGPGGVVYLNRVVGRYGFLERANVR